MNIPQNNSAVDVVYLVENDVYLVEALPWNRKFEVAGLPARVPFTLARPEDLIEVVTPPPYVDHYVNNKTQEELHPVAYHARREELLANADAVSYTHLTLPTNREV